MEVQYQTDFLHGGEDGEVIGVVQHAGRGVGGDACRVGFDAGDASGSGGADDGGSDGGVEVEGHEVGYRGVEGLEAGAVGEGLLDGGDGRIQVGLGRLCVSSGTKSTVWKQRYEP